MREREIKKEEVRVQEVMMLSGEDLDYFSYLNTLNAPSWDVRIRQLMSIMSYPYEMEELNSPRIIVDLSVIPIIVKELEEIR